VPAFRVKLGANDLNCVDVPLNPTHSLAQMLYSNFSYPLSAQQTNCLLQWHIFMAHGVDLLVFLLKVSCGCWSVSDSGSYESSHSSINRDSSGSHRHHRRRRPSADQHRLSPQCNGAGDSVGDDYMMEHLPDEDAATEDGLSAEYETCFV